MATRLYIVEIGDKVRLIEAASKAAARSFALKDMANVRAASAKDALDLAEDGIKRETAGSDE